MNLKDIFKEEYKKYLKESEEFFNDKLKEVEFYVKQNFDNDNSLVKFKFLNRFDDLMKIVYQKHGNWITNNLDSYGSKIIANNIYRNILRNPDKYNGSTTTSLPTIKPSSNTPDYSNIPIYGNNAQKAEYLVLLNKLDPKKKEIIDSLVKLIRKQSEGNRYGVKQPSLATVKALINVPDIQLSKYKNKWERATSI